MRWPWQPHGSSPEPRTSRRHGDEPSPSGWAFLPPLQRTVGPVPSVVDPGQFPGRLASWSDPSFLGPTSHLIDAAAPAGVIDVDGGGLPAEPIGRAMPVEMPLH